MMGAVVLTLGGSRRWRYGATSARGRHVGVQLDTTKNMVAMARSGRLSLATTSTNGVGGSVGDLLSSTAWRKSSRKKSNN